MPDIKGKKILVIGGAGFIGSHVVDELLKEDIGGITIYDNFVRGTPDNIENALRLGHWDIKNKQDRNR